ASPSLLFSEPDHGLHYPHAKAVRLEDEGFNPIVESEPTMGWFHHTVADGRRFRAAPGKASPYVHDILAKYDIFHNRHCDPMRSGAVRLQVLEVRTAFADRSYCTGAFKRFC
ncbi:MAG: hypothetical protein OEU92_26065, partial [Alphaproteobacteria bacterium]|nr:hypothetical protein [Alphaproteobacteria bacterium]